MSLLASWALILAVAAGLLVAFGLIASLIDAVLHIRRRQQRLRIEAQMHEDQAWLRTLHPGVPRDEDRS